jgi:hypothetical protein
MFAFEGQTMRHDRFTMLGLLLPVLLPVLLPAQVTTFTLSGEPACGPCRIEVSRVATIGAIPGISPSRDSRIARDTLGNYYVVVEPGPRVAVVDASRHFVRLVDWRTSRTDTTARGVIPLVDWSGDLHIFDGFTQSHYLPDGRPNDRVALPGFLTMDTGAAWSLVAPAPSPVPHRTFVATASFWNVGTPPAPAFDLAGAYAVDSVRSNPACRDCADIAVAVTPVTYWKGTVWTAMSDRYRLDLYDGWGKKQRVSIAVTNAWLPIRDSAAYTPGRMLPETPRITGLWFDLNGCARLSGSWSRWQAGPNACERVLWVAGLTMADSTSHDDATRYVTVIDAIGITAPRNISGDPFIQSARIVARTRLPGRADLFAPGAVYQRRQAADGSWAIDVFLLAVRPQ